MTNATNLIIRTQITGIEKTPAIEDYVEKKLRLLEKRLAHYAHESGELYFDVELEKTTDHHKKGSVFRAEINFTAGSVNFRAEETEEDLYAAIDKAKDEMERELRRTKNKHIERARRGGAKLKALLRGWRK